MRGGVRGAHAVHRARGLWGAAFHAHVPVDARACAPRAHTHVRRAPEVGDCAVRVVAAPPVGDFAGLVGGGQVSDDGCAPYAGGGGGHNQYHHGAEHCWR